MSLRGEVKPHRYVTLIGFLSLENAGFTGWVCTKIISKQKGGE